MIMVSIKAGTKIPKIHITLNLFIKMRNILLVIAGILIIIWAVGLFVFSSENTIHILPVLALLILIKRLIKEDEMIYAKKNHTWKTLD